LNPEDGVLGPEDGALNPEDGALGAEDGAFAAGRRGRLPKELDLPVPLDFMRLTALPR